MKSSPGKYADNLAKAAGSAADRLGSAVYHASGYRVIPVEERLSRWRSLQSDPVKLQSYVLQMADQVGAVGIQDVDKIARDYIREMQDLEQRYGGGNVSV